MKDGYYLSTFLVDGKLPCALDIKLRHDQTVALWYKKSDTIELVRYWELERFSGWKQHTFTFFSTEQLYSTIEFLLKTVGLKMEDIVEIWGTPSIDTANDYIDENVYNGIGYHNICHLFSAFLCEENKENEDILMFALDSGPDSVGQYGAYYKLYYSGAYWHDNSLEIFPVQSPGKLWSSSKKRFCMREGTLMALASACKAEVNVDYNKEVELIDEAALENALEYLDGLAKHIEKYGFSVDERFSEKEIKKVVKAINFQEAIEAVKENREPIEFKDLYPHAIRHTFCSRCFEKGMDAKVVQMLMGHQHYSTTIDIYTHVTETKFEEEIAKFGSVSEKQKVQKNKNSTQCA